MHTQYIGHMNVKHQYQRKRKYVHIPECTNISGKHPN